MTALDDATMSVDQGEFVALLGPSGSGKTTLISIIGGLLSATSGTVTLGDVDVTALSKRELTKFRAERVGFVFFGAHCSVASLGQGGEARPTCFDCIN